MILSEDNWLSCCFVISLSFQKIGGFADEIVKFISLLILYSFASLKIFLHLFNRVLRIKILSSFVYKLSFKIFNVFFVFFAKQLSISSEILWFSIKFVNFDKFSVFNFFFPFKKRSIFESIKLATATASLKCKKEGGIYSIPNLVEVKKVAKNLKVRKIVSINF